MAAGSWELDFYKRFSFSTSGPEPGLDLGAFRFQKGIGLYDLITYIPWNITAYHLVNVNPKIKKEIIHFNHLFNPRVCVYVAMYATSPRSSIL